MRLKLVYWFADKARHAFMDDYSTIWDPIMPEISTREQIAFFLIAFRWARILSFRRAERVMLSYICGDCLEGQRGRFRHLHTASSTLIDLQWRWESSRTENWQINVLRWKLRTTLMSSLQVAQVVSDNQFGWHFGQGVSLVLFLEHPICCQCCSSIQSHGKAACHWSAYFTLYW